MGTEASARFLSRLVILCLVFTFWQLGSESKYQSTAQMLPIEEVTALRAILSRFGLKNVFENTDGSFCNETTYYLGEIKCDCNKTICHVTKIDLASNGYTGKIHEDIANLTHLEFLDLSRNKLTGSIPASLGKLPSLYYLDLSFNQLTGSIPASLGKMKFKILSRSFVNGEFAALLLDLSYNQLNGSIPATLGHWAVSSAHFNNSRYYLILEGNRLTGPIPESLGDLTFAARRIKLCCNFLNGSIPPSLAALTNLKKLDLTLNGISGTLPQALGNLTNLEEFSVGMNRISGTIPKYFAGLTSLEQFDVSGNYLSGTIPHFIANWTSCDFLMLSGNNFHGGIPIGIFTLPQLAFLAINDVEDSHFRFPASTNLTTSNLYYLTLRNCLIGGQVPSFIGNMSSLKALDLSFNRLTGSIPDSLKNLFSEDLYIDLSNNMLSGEIPYWIQNRTLKKQLQMDLSYNNFSKLTFEPSNKSTLNLFSCCCNSSTCLPNTMDPNRIKEEYCPRGKPNYHSLFINCGGGEAFVDGNVYEQDNDTSQFYLSRHGNWARTSAGKTIIGFQRSELVKSVRCGLSEETLLYNTARTSPLSLKYYGFCLRKGKYSVTLQFSEIVGEEDPEETVLGRIKDIITDRHVFDVYIQGMRRLKDFNIKDKAGGRNIIHTENFTAVDVNDGQLEIHLYSTGVLYNQGPLISAISITPEYKLQEEEQLSPLQIALITLASITVFVLLLLLFAWMMGWLGNTDHKQEIDIGLENPITLKQLKAATRNFSKRNEIGQGGFGTVYKADVQGKTVAVKKLSSHSEERINQLKNEFYTLKSICHENLVQLLDVYHAKGLHLLIYEYMQNKSLAHALYDSKFKLDLSWEARFNICLGIARGLVYLHEHPRLKMVHSDIKAANILLDGSLKPKISDFGLASLYTEDDQFKFIKVEVTQGYMAPEYVRGIVTTKVDVYSFGVVMLEIVSGKTNAGQKRDSHESEFLLDTAYDLHRKRRLVDLVDRTLSARYDAKQAIIILNLAVKCTNISPTLRPTMSEVVSVLVGEKSIEDICSPAVNDSHVAQVDSVASNPSIEVTSGVSTSSNFIKGEDESEHIPESTP